MNGMTFSVGWWRLRRNIHTYIHTCRISHIFPSQIIEHLIARSLVHFSTFLLLFLSLSPETIVLIVRFHLARMLVKIAFFFAALIELQSIHHFSSLVRALKEMGGKWRCEQRKRYLNYSESFLRFFFVLLELWKGNPCVRTINFPERKLDRREKKK